MIASIHESIACGLLVVAACGGSSGGDDDDGRKDFDLLAVIVRFDQANGSERSFNLYGADLETGATTKLVAAERLSWSHDRTKVALVNITRADAIYTLADGAKSEVTQGDFRDWSPDDHHMLVDVGDGAFVVVDDDGTEHALPVEPDLRVSFTDAGSWAGAFALVQDPNHLLRMNPDGTDSASVFLPDDSIADLEVR